MFVFGSASDWVLRRLFKVFLKRNLANFLATEVDVQQLGIQLDKGSLELKECLLDIEYLNERLGNNRSFEFISVLIGRVEVSLFPPAIVLDDTVVTLRQLDPASRQNETTATNPLLEPPISVPSFADYDLQDTAIGEGVKVISKSLHNLLGSIHVESNRLIGQLELSSGHTVVLNIDAACLASTDSKSAEDELLSDKTRLFTFSGLSFQILGRHKSLDDLERKEEEEIVAAITSHQGCHGKIEIDWSLLGDDGDDDGRDEEDQHSTLRIRAEIQGLHIESSPYVVTPLLHLAQLANKPSYSNSAGGGIAAQAARTDFINIIPSKLDAESIMKALMLPDGEHLLEEELFSCTPSDNDLAHPGEEVDEFFDAVSEIMSQSMFSTRSLASSFMSEVKPLHASTHEENIEEANDIEIELIVTACSLSMTCPLPGEQQCSKIQLACSGVSIRSEVSQKNSQLVIFFDRMQVVEHKEMECSVGAEDRSLSNCSALLSTLPTNPMERIEEHSFMRTIAQLENLRTGDWNSPHDVKVLPILELSHRDHSSAISIVCSSSVDMTSVAITTQGLLLALDSQLIARISAVCGMLTEQLHARNDDSQQSPSVPHLKLFVYVPDVSVILFHSPLPPLVAQSSAANHDAKKIHEALRTRVDHLAAEDVSPLLCVSKCETGTSISLAFATINAYVRFPNDPEVEFSSEPLAIAAGTCLHVDVDETLNDPHRHLLRQYSEGINNVSCRNILVRGKLDFTITKSLIALLPKYPSEDRPLSECGISSLRCISFEQLTLSLVDDLSKKNTQVHATALAISQLSSNSKCVYNFSMQLLSLLDGSNQIVQVRKKPAAIVVNIEKIADFGSSPLQRINIQFTGVLFKGDFFTEVNFWTKLKEWIPESAAQTRDTEPSGNELSIHASDCLLVHVPPVDTFTIAVLVEDFCLVRCSSDTRTILKNISVHVAEREDTSMSDDFATNLQQNGYTLIAQEQLLKIEDKVISSGNMNSWKQLFVQAEEIRVIFNKRSALLVKFAIDQINKQMSLQRPEGVNKPVLTQSGTDIGDAIQADILRNIPETANCVDIIRDTRESDSDVISDHQVEFSNSKATVGGDGAWFGASALSEMMVADHVEGPSGDEFLSGDLCPSREIILRVCNASIVFADSLHVTGYANLVEGEVKASVHDAAFRVCTFGQADVDCCRKIAFIVRGITVRHNLDNCWSNSIAVPFRQARLSAIDIFLSAAPESDWLVIAKLAPMRVHLDQIMLLFMNEFFSVSNMDAWEEVTVGCDDDIDHGDTSNPYLIQRCRIEGFPVYFSYKPWAIDANALRGGSLMEVVNCLPELKAKLKLSELLMRGPMNMHLLRTNIAFSWLEDVKHQLPSFVPGAGSFMVAADVLRRAIAMIRNLLQ